jgi:penicillin amidase
MRILRLLLRGLLVAVAVVVCVAVGIVAWGWWSLRGSLPRLDGEATLAGLGAPVEVTRDALGVPTIRGASRQDVARATGFVQAQDRFFQMDLLRRKAAGTLAALVGPVLVASDKEVRAHRFAEGAARALADSSPEDRAFLEAYAAGVNAGLAALRRPPFEYFLLRETPQPWKPEDTLLCVYAMFLDLQDDGGRTEAGLGTLHDTLPEPLYAFLAPRGTEFDAPLTGSPIPTPPIPGPDVLDLRATEGIARRGGGPGRGAAGRGAEGRVGDAGEESPQPGSNNWAVAGRLTKDGGALLASDMHLGLAVPNIWYRASLVWPEEGRERRVTGVMLPGTPVVAAGSNGEVAWAFTNTEGDWSDLVLLEIDPADADRYRTPSGWQRFEHVKETIAVHGAPAQALETLWTIWGPVVDQDTHGRPRALRWTAHERGAVNIALRRLETAGSIEAALEDAAASGIPAQNFVCAAHDGRIAWTIAGRMPRRVGFDGRLPTSWADGTHRWEGWLEPRAYPRLVDPAGGRLWTANARVLDGAPQALIGDGGLALGFRAGRIRDDLLAIERAGPSDMLGVQLDDRSLFYDRWRDVLLGALTPAATAAAPARGEARRLVQQWSGRAAVDSAGYRIVRAFRAALAAEVFDSLTERCRDADPAFRYTLSQREGPLWALVRERPAHLLPPAFSSWDARLLAALDRALADLTRDGTPLQQATWGRRNLLRMQHPLSVAVGRLSPWLDMPREPLPGDDQMPRVQAPDFGASERMVVSPGREQEGLFTMPGGESGHPLSPYYRAGHEAWANGEPRPFLPGAAEHTLHLVPVEADSGRQH